MAKQCASVRTLTEIKDVTDEDAKRIRAAWSAMTRERLIAEFPNVADYVRQCYNDPATIMLRRMAIDAILRTHGVEFLGVRRRTGESVYYCNAGDTYATTVIFSGNTLRVGCWGDLVERGAIREPS